jgi:hypothetical protein
LRDKEIHGRPPGAIAITSPYDLDARYSVKRGAGWNGYKVQFSEGCDDERPHLITYVETVPATEADIDTTTRVHESLARRDLVPVEHLADSAYVTADAVLDAHARHSIELVGPVGQGNQWQGRNSGAFDIDAFTIDSDALTAVCLQGHHNTWSGTGTDRHGKPRVMFTFSLTDCTPCPVRSRCTRAKTAARTESANGDVVVLELDEPLPPRRRWPGVVTAALHIRGLPSWTPRARLVWRWVLAAHARPAGLTRTADPSHRADAPTRTPGPRRLVAVISTWWRAT